MNSLILASAMREAAPFFVSVVLLVIGALFAALAVREAEAQYDDLRKSADEQFRAEIAQLGLPADVAAAVRSSTAPDATYPSLDRRSLSAPTVWMGDVASMFPGLAGPLVATLLLYDEINEPLLYSYLAATALILILTLAFLLYVKPGNYPRARIGVRGRWLSLWRFGPVTPGVLLAIIVNLVAGVVVLLT